MRNRLYAFGLVLLSTSIAACAGGGGGGTFTPSTQGQEAPILGAQQQPTPPGSQPTPAAAGTPNTFMVTGSLTRSDVYTYPATNPLPDSSVTAQVTQNTTVSRKGNPFGSKPQQDFHTVESDAYALQTLMLTTDSFFDFDNPTTPTKLLLFGSTSVDDQGNKFFTQYDTPQIVEELPPMAGQSWTNSPAARITTNSANGNSTNRKITATGTYGETDLFANGAGGTVYPSVLLSSTTAADGSARIVFTFNEEGRVNFPFKTEIFTFVFSKPASQGIALSESQFNVPVTGTPPPSPSPKQFGVAPTWFRTPLFTETDVNNGVVTIPTSCHVPPGFGKTASQIVQKKQVIDNAFGNVDTTTTTRYVATGFGALCVQVSDINNAFYDYSLSDFTNQAPQQFFAFSTTAAQPLIATTIAETLTLQKASTSATTASSIKLEPIAASAIADAQLSVFREATQLRVKRLQQAIQRISDALGRGGQVK